MKFGSGRRSGFSLVEFLVCVAILATAIIFIVDIFSTMVNASTKGADWSVATYLAAAQLDKMVADPSVISAIYAASNGGVYHTAPVVYSGGASEPVAVASLNHTTYYVTYTIALLNNTETPIDTGRQLYSVDAQVQWFGPNPAIGAGPSAAGYGMLSTHLARLVYVH